MVKVIIKMLRMVIRRVKMVSRMVRIVTKMVRLVNRKVRRVREGLKKIVEKKHGLKTLDFAYRSFEDTTHLFFQFWGGETLLSFDPGPKGVSNL